MRGLGDIRIRRDECEQREKREEEEEGGRT
jgi:hypothetical protein